MYHVTARGNRRKDIFKEVARRPVGPQNTQIGQNLDLVAKNQMDKKGELHKQLQMEMKWAQDKQTMLNFKESKLLLMREIAEQGKKVRVTPQELRNLNHRLGKLAAQVSAIDSESSRTKDGKKLE